MTELETKIWNTVHNWCDVQSNEIPDQNRRYLMDEMKALVLSHVINSATAQMIHYDLAIKANELMKQHNNMKVEDFRELPEVKRLWNAMDVIKEYYL